MKVREIERERDTHIHRVAKLPLSQATIPSRAHLEAFYIAHCYLWLSLLLVMLDVIERFS